MDDIEQKYVDAGNRLKDSQLAKMKRIATGLLFAAAFVYTIATLLRDQYPWMVYVIYTAEAGMVGALADWFAVVALFRHPLNLKFIPHTAIFPANKKRLAQQLGEFVQEKFMSSHAVTVKLQENDPALQLADWLGKPHNVQALSNYAIQLFAYVLSALDDQRIRGFLLDVVKSKLAAVDFPAAAARFLDVSTRNKRHHALLDEILGWLGNVVPNPETEAWLTAEIAKYPLVKLADAFGMQLAPRMAQEMVQVATRKLAEVEQDRDHPMRRAFDRYAAEFIDKLKQDEATRTTVQQIKDEIVLSPVVADYVGGLWSELRAWLARDLESHPSVLRQHVGEFLSMFAHRLRHDKAVQEWVNAQVLHGIPPLIESNRQQIGRFIEEQVLRWKDEKLVAEIERNIGPDLQYVRINGTVVGAMAGLLITVGTHLMQALY